MSAPSYDPAWLEWNKRLQAIAQNGLTFAQDPYDIDRYTALRELAASMLAHGSGIDTATLRPLLDHDTGYTTPKVDVRGVVFRDDRILLVRERSDGLWTLPGGWADVCAAPAENVVREIQEESGYLTRAEKLLAVFDRSRHPHTPLFAHHVYKFFFLCSLVGGTSTISNETDAVDFFAESEIPPLSISRVTPQQIERMFEHRRDPALPTDFDQ